MCKQEIESNQESEKQEEDQRENEKVQAAQSVAVTVSNLRSGEMKMQVSRAPEYTTLPTSLPNVQISQQCLHLPRDRFLWDVVGPSGCASLYSCGLLPLFTASSHCESCQLAHPGMQLTTAHIPWHELTT